MRKRWTYTAKIFSASIIYFLCCHVVKAQVPRTVPVNYTSATPVSFVRTWTATAPEQDANTFMTRPLRDVKQATQYLDGLGRPLQTVIKEGSLTTNPVAKKDMVSPVEYDELGREQHGYLPYADPTVTGAFKLDPFAQQAAFYNSSNTASPIYNQGENFFYSKVNFELSPLNRPVENYAPGDSWVKTETTTKKGTKINYYINTLVDEVRIWTVTNNSTVGLFGSYASGGIYPAGTLYKTITTDENNKQVVEFKDKEGKVILKKVQLTATADAGAGNNHTGWLCTYYLYDDFNQLRCVIQPRGVELIASNFLLTDATILAEQCFRYEYDYRNRMIMKKVPGAGEVYMVYDIKDRLVMTQDANMRTSNKWMVTLYDFLNRPVQTGLLLNTYNNFTFATHLSTAFYSTTYPFTATPSTTYWEYLTKTGYDDYTAVPSASGLTAYMDLGNINGYGFFSSYNVSPDYAQQLPYTLSTKTKGMATWTETKVLNTTTYLYSVIIYDDNGRPVQVKSKNITGGTDISTTQFSWSGQPLVIVQKQEKAMTPVQTSIVVTKIFYDDIGRQIQVDKKIQNSNVNGNVLPTDYTTVSKNEYDALGQLKKKFIGSKKNPSNNTYYSPSQPLQELVYDYNIRGWMLGMNRDYMLTEGQTSDEKYFGFELGYDKATTKSGRSFTSALQYNGNITGMVWKSDGDDIRRKYDFSYDAVNRLMKGDFEQQNGDNHAWNNSQVNYSMKMGDGTLATSAYDANGNIMAMTQFGYRLGVASTTPIDNLTYSYNTNTNKLKQVTDGNNDNSSKLGDFKYDAASKTATDYSYDVNGNLSIDNNKKISSITYNHLHLPSVITVTGKGNITYTYDAAGNKQKKVITETNAVVPLNGTNYTSNITTTTTYLGGSVFETKDYSHVSLASLKYTDRLLFIGQEEGRIRFKTENATLHYDYMLKDHLGNVRMVLTEEVQTDMYPAATMEAATATTEELIYANLLTTRTTTLPAGYPTNTPAGNAKVAVVKAASGYQKIGPAITLKVMAGDKFNLTVNSWYKKNGVTPGAPVPLFNELISALTGNIAGVGGKATVTEITNSGVLNAVTPQFLNTQTVATGVPKAYINWILFDEQFKIVGANSSFEQVGVDQEYKTHTKANMPINKNGYLYIYVSNETPNIDVFFDNLQVTHVRGPIIEETHYYPGGLVMAGISSNAAGKLENKRKWNKGSELESKEFSDGSGLELYSTFYRSLDPQLGRFWQLDPKPNFSESLYAAMGNNPIMNMDPLGDTLLNEADHKIANRIEKKIKSRNASLNKTASKLNRQIAKAEAKGKTETAADLRAELNDVDKQTKTNSNSLTRLNAIRNDPKEAYTFNQLPETSTEGGTMLGITKNPKGEDQVAVIMSITSDVNALHEIIHAAQGAIEHSLTLIGGGVLFSGGNNEFKRGVSNTKSEIDAYRSQFSLDPTSMPASTNTTAPTSLNGVSATYVGGINGGNGKPLYPNVQNTVNTINQLLRIY